MPEDEMPDDAVPRDGTWVVVIPAKSLATAKSRLADVAGTRRPELALAMLLDTLTAAAATHGVRSILVVTDDDRIGAATTALGVTVVSDEPRAGLNAALEHGITIAASIHPGCGVAVLTGDLPALRPAELGSVLHFASTSAVSAPSAGSAAMVVVADRAGDGTTLLAASEPANLRPSFGAGSFARHRALGAVAVEGSVEGLRCDVDDEMSLRAALGIGVGRATAALLAGEHARGPG
jgi:2-phospho-L-lactate/phosphoenolpyruvate guanylyltransferase